MKGKKRRCHYYNSENFTKDLDFIKEEIKELKNKNFKRTEEDNYKIQCECNFLYKLINELYNDSRGYVELKKRMELKYYGEDVEKYCKEKVETYYISNFHKLPIEPMD